MLNVGFIVAFKLRQTGANMFLYPKHGICKKGKETGSHGMQTITQQGKRHVHVYVDMIVKKKTLNMSKSRYTWHVHVWWHSKCVKQSNYHSKGMYKA